jgi:hypothetical protein
MEFDGTELDFWLGDWDATWAGGRGRNRLRRIMRRKVIHERFDGTDGESGRLRGQSWSVFEPARRLWRQTWVDDAGSYFDLVGAQADGWFAFERAAPERGAEARQRMVFRDITDETFRWTWEFSADGGSTWELRWEISYRRS